MNKTAMILLVCLLTLIFTSPAFSQDVNLSWDASPSDNVAGYKVYYSQSDESFPFVGTGASEGDSPIDVGNSLSATISNLEDNAIYYFSVTAYDSDGNESTYSNVVNTGWKPLLMEPSHQASGLTPPVHAEWEAAPEGYDVSFILFYGTDQQAVEDASITPLPPVTPFRMQPPGLPLITLGILLTMLTILFAGRVPKTVTFRPALPVALLLIGGLLVACSGGGGSGGNSTISIDSSASAEIANSDTGTVDTGTVDTGTVDTGTVDTGTVDTGTVDTGTVDTGTVVTEVIDLDTLGTGSLYSVDLGTANSYEISGLQSGTTYYWKIVAVDEANSALEYQSAVYSFTTAD